MLLLEAIIALLAAFGGALIALGLQRRRLQTAPQQGWEHALENTLRNWEVKQEKRITDLETSLTTQLHQVQQGWEKWETEDAARVETLAQDYKTATMLLNLEHELARILPTEETPLTISTNGQSRPMFVNWRPAMLQGANLRKRELSHRYLGHANLREAQLAGATLLMTNLSGACLVGANLSHANLSGTDLSGADLSDAILTDANLLVADLHNTILTGANLLGARGLTIQQLQSAIYDDTTLFDSDLNDSSLDMQSIHKGREMHITQPRLEIVNPGTLPAPTKAPRTPEEVVAPEMPVAPVTPELSSQGKTLPSTALPHMTPFVEYVAEADGPPKVSKQGGKGSRRNNSVTPKQSLNGK